MNNKQLRIKLLSIVLFLGIIDCYARQDTTIMFSYDCNGNRISRETIILRNNKANKTPLTDTIGANVYKFCFEKNYDDQNDNKVTEITIYPNPTESKIYVYTRKDFYFSYYLSRIKGEYIAKGKFKKELVLDLSSERPGIYILKLFTKDKQKVFKVLKE